MIKNYYILDVAQISQLKSGTGAVFTGKLSFEELLTIHRLTERKESLEDPFGKKIINYQKEEDEEFQRHLSEKKLNEIKRYLIEEINNPQSSISVFPSSLIISLDINENNSEDLTEQKIAQYYTDDLDSCFVTNSGNFKKLYIPKNKRICLIVDGQHRFYGLKKYFDDLKIETDKKKVYNFEFITTILLGFDSYQVSQVFANVNFHQKPVNRSLYYDIFGASSNDKNEIQLAHYLVLHLQNNEDSPLKNMIKLLGKGYGLFSQAFFVEKVLIHYYSGGVWESLYEDFKNNGKTFLKIPTFIKLYFNSIREHYPDCWPEKVERDGELVYSSFAYDYILCKTTGMGAFLRLIKDIYPRTENINTNSKAELDKIFGNISASEAEQLFSKNGDFGGGGSEGLQLRLYKFLKERLGV